MFPPPPSSPVNTFTQEHQWGPQIYVHSIDDFTYHFHVCTVCRTKGIRRKVSNRKASITPLVAICVPRNN